jgi:hypothetical protein
MLFNEGNISETFAGMSGRSNRIWVFSRIFFCSFIVLFTYVISKMFVTLLKPGPTAVATVYKETHLQFMNEQLHPSRIT